jgi:hypothetical protein
MEPLPRERLRERRVEDGCEEVTIEIREGAARDDEDAPSLRIVHQVVEVLRVPVSEVQIEQVGVESPAVAEKRHGLAEARGKDHVVARRTKAPDRPREQRIVLDDEDAWQVRGQSPSRSALRSARAAGSSFVDTSRRSDISSRAWTP